MYFLRLALGTVEFGLSYGVDNKDKPSLEEAFRILDYALYSGITVLDTAQAYGNSEEVIGEYLKRYPGKRKEIRIVSKTEPGLLEGIAAESYYATLRENVLVSLSRLATDYLDGLLFHDAPYAKNPVMLSALHSLRSEREKGGGLVRKTGVSVYEVEDACTAIGSDKVDLIQVPYSILDQRMAARGVFDEARKNQVEIHVRSIFLQGLVFLSMADTPVFLPQARSVLQKLEAMSSNTGLSRLELAIGFAKTHAYSEQLLVGVNNVEQLQECVQAYEREYDPELMQNLRKTFEGTDDVLVRPHRWDRSR